METADGFIARFEAWARAQPDIRGAFLVGSHGRGEKTPDSDVDIAFVTRRPQRYAQPRRWLPALGTVWSAVYDADDPLRGLPTSASLFSAFDGGVCVDFSILPEGRTRLWLSLVQRRFLRERILSRDAEAAAFLFCKGIRVLFDHDGLVARLDALKALPAPGGEPPSPASLEALQEDFWLGAVQMARYLMRGRMYAAYGVRERVLRRDLITLMQWQAQARGGWGDALRVREARLEQWADAEFTAHLSSLLAGYGAAPLWASLRSACAVFSAQWGELAAALGYALDERGRAPAGWVEAAYERWRESHGQEGP